MEGKQPPDRWLRFFLVALASWFACMRQEEGPERGVSGWVAAILRRDPIVGYCAHHERNWATGRFGLFGILAESCRRQRYRPINEWIASRRLKFHMYGRSVELKHGGREVTQHADQQASVLQTFRSLFFCQDS